MLPGLLPLLLLLMLCVQAVSAHTGMAVTIPEHDAVLSEAPSHLIFQFMADVTITNIRLEISAGERSGEQFAIRLPRNSVGQSTAYGDHISLELPPLAPAVYLVTWQAISQDGHIIVDDFNFTVSN